MDKTVQNKIETQFLKTVHRDRKVKNAFLLVHSESHGIHINLSHGSKDSSSLSTQQPHYMASCGKLFTATIFGQFHERGDVSFDDKISSYLDDELMKQLHLYKGKDYSGEIEIRHLLNQTSGLPDNFYPLFDKLLADPDFNITPREAVIWAKENLTPSAPPGTKSYYTDTNYHLLGLIAEKVTGAPFHSVLSSMIFDPLGMDHAFMLQVSEPRKKSSDRVADFYFKKRRLNDLRGFSGIDYAGGGVVAPPEELLIFMKALVNGEIVSGETLDLMKADKANLFPNFEYGYGIWQVKPIPLLIPEKLKSWGVLGATGAFMFYHPKLDIYLIGNFNHSSYKQKCVRFMFKVINLLWKSRN
ncbi:serine hydrolase domain-containing protein [Rhodohalobacter halophilus]|uniref:serine hydrolase domain-containing protein n=1 Tax=Rhodohalobacter halophilus TaxID=1812810 RepID=UPI00083F7738|nr:serine hydrolase [Rhodohalobacter halophilus]